jgi:dTDP-4-dehydrorhamnose reductase
MARGKLLGMPMRGASRRSSDLAIDAHNLHILEQALNSVNPAVVINCAGLIDVNECERSPHEAWLANVRIPSLLAGYCASHFIKLIHISTDHYYTGSGALPHNESHPVVLVNEYARSKYAGECMALTCPKALVIRTNIVGFRGWRGQPTFVEWLVGALVKQTPIELYSDFYTSSISVSQLAELLFNLIKTRASGVLNLASSQGASKQEFACAFAVACGLSTHATIPGTVRSLSGVRRAESLVLDTSLAERLLGAPLPDLDAVVQQLAQEYRERKFSIEV